MDQDNSMDTAKAAVLQAALAHVPFDGWSQTTLTAAIADSGTAPGLALALFPRGAVDLALAYHLSGDRVMTDRLAAADLTTLRYRDRIATAVRYRLEACQDKELVRRGTTLFALPQNAGDGIRAIWGTADAIWKALGDTSDDINWYSKRATLSAVYTATVVFWLGDDSPDHHATWEFLDRRIENVMQVEKLKASARNNPLSKAILAGPLRFLGRVKAPVTPGDLPGSVNGGR